MTLASRQKDISRPSPHAKGGWVRASLVAGVIGLLTTVSSAADWTVSTLTDDLDTPAGASLSLREAIRDSASGDTIRFAAELDGGTMLLTRGSLVIGKSLMIDAMSLVSGITIDGDLKQRVFYTSAATTIRGVTITRGSAGGVLSFGDLTMEHCLVSDCTNFDSGAGIRHSSGTLNLFQCSILSNRMRSGLGGGGVWASGNARLVNCTIADNEGQYASGFSFGGSTANLIHCTVINNRSTAFSSAAVTTGPGTLRLQNSVVAGNLAETISGSATRRDVAMIGGTLQKIGVNFISCNNGVTTLFPEAATVGTVAAPKDPILSTMGFHGGRTPCFFPLSGSKLINAATTSADTPSVDQRNFARISGPKADLGAVEATSSVYFPADGVARQDLSPVLEWSHQLSATLYSVYLGTVPGSLALQGTTSTGRMALPEMPANTTFYWRIDSVVGGVTVEGPLQSFTTRPAIIVSKAGDEAADDLSQEGVSLREALALANADAGLDIIRFHPDLAGIDLQVTQGSLIVSSDLRIEGDSLPGGTGIVGGAFRITAPTELRSLSLGGGSGDAGFGTIHVTSSFTARNCTIAGNRSTYGGGIYLQSGSCSLIHCTVTKNTANLSGGGIYNNGGILTLENCLIAGNRALESSPDIRATASLVKRGANLIGNNSNSQTQFPGSSLTGTPESPLDPALGPADRHVAGMSSHGPPLPGSPAIGQAIFLPTTPVTDQLGRPRPLDGSACLGAVESDPGLVLSLPPSGETDTLWAPELFWSLPGDLYEVFVGTSPEALSSVGTSTQGSFQLPELLENTGYYWRVDRSTNGTTSVGTVSTFTTRRSIVISTLTDEDDPDPTSGDGVSLREALAIAGARPGPDRIRFGPSLAAGKITLSGPDLSTASECEIDATDLDGGITLDLAGSRHWSIGVTGEVTIRGMNITGAKEPTAGTAILNSGVTSLFDLSVYGNQGTGGAALRNASGRLIIDRCSFTENLASYYGGALDLASGTARVSNCTFYGNRAAISGGAIQCNGSSEFTHCTIFGNLSKDAGGIMVGSARCVLANCIVAGNTAIEGPDRRDLSAFHASYVSQRGSNLIGVNTGFETLFPSGPLAGTKDSPLDPGLIVTGGSMDASPALHPVIGSPALDGGLLLTPQPPLDQLGTPRVSGTFPDLGSVEAAPGSARFQPSDLATGIQPCDLLGWHFEPGADSYRILLSSGGAPLAEAGTSTAGSFLATLEHGTDYQWQVLAIRGETTVASPVLRFTTRPQVVVTTLADENDPVPTDGDGVSLREAIHLAATIPGRDMITFSPALPSDTLPLNGGELAIDSDLTIDGTIPTGKLVIDAGRQSRIFSSHIWDVEAQLEDLVLSHGHTDASGGGIFNSARMKLTRVEILACSSEVSGGAIVNSGQMELDSCGLLFNQANDQGNAFYDWGSRFRAVNSTVSFNRPNAPSVDGSFSAGTAITANHLDLINCTVASNRGWRAAIKASRGDLTHTTVTGNLATIGTAGIEWTQSLFLRNCIVAGNTTSSVYGTSTDGTTTTWTYWNDDLVGPDSGLQIEGSNLVGNNYRLESVFPAGPLVGTPASRLSPGLLDLGNHGGPTLTAPPAGGSPARRAAAAINNPLPSDQRGVPRTEGIPPDLGAADHSGFESAFFPLNGEIAVSTCPRLSWIFEPTADQFEVFVGSSPAAMSSHGTVEIPTMVLTDLDPLATYYWKVVASVSGTPIESPVQQFTTRDFLTVHHPGDPMGHESPGMSLRQATAVAEVQPGHDRIVFAAALSETGVTLAGRPVDLSGRVTLSNDRDLLGLSGNSQSGILRFWPGSEYHLENLSLHDGRSDSGAGIFAGRSKGSIVRCEFEGNVATSNAAFGGGILHSGGPLLVESCLFAGNQADNSGGGISVSDSEVQVRNSTFSGNSSSRGGAIDGSSSADLEHCTLFGNEASQQGGAINLSRWSSIRIANCLIAGNQVVGSTLSNPGHDLYYDSPFNSSLIERVGSNFIGTNNSCSVLFPTGPNVGSTASPLDPMLAPLADRGGITRCHLPLTGSPAIDATVTSAGPPALDQRGLPRPQGSAPDIGAVEVLALGAAPVDVDLDGMDDRLESLWGFVVGLNDGSGDDDGDGSSNADELGNHTNPRDPGDFLRIIASSITLPPTAGGEVLINLTWSTFPGLGYTIERSSHLDFEGEELRALDAGIASGFTRSMSVPLATGRDFARIRRD